MDEKLIFLFNRQLITTVKRLKADPDSPAAARSVIAARFRAVDKRSPEHMDEYWAAAGGLAGLDAMTSDFGQTQFLDCPLADVAAVAGHALPRLMYLLAWLRNSGAGDEAEELVRCGLYAVQAAAGMDTTWAPAAADESVMRILESIAEPDAVEAGHAASPGSGHPPVGLVADDPMEAMMADSRIGKLAQSICADISSSGVLNEDNLADLMSPDGIDVDKIMRGVMGDGTNTNPLLKTIIEKVSSGVQREMSSGEEEGALMEEAMNLFGTLTSNMSLNDFVPKPPL